MKWFSHILIGGAIAAPFNPAGVPLAILGATAPDWMEWVSAALGKKLKHRGPTHYLAVWLAALVAAAMIDFNGFLFWFVLGGLSHLFCDSLTMTGIPVGWWSPSRFHLFGGRLRTGQPAEYVIAGGVVLTAFMLVQFMRPYGAGGYVPFFHDWYGYYDAGLIDASELKRNRFNFF